ncbi:RsfA family transcriptional regulator [Paenibacillus illinoisensis]|uniref:RsfA family transcriptional regulator n=1 Tax=Paenibacillus illinoisensis TaxID=59845 RepID=UPI00301CA77D
MNTNRSDSWSTADDLILAETILDHIRNGSTQLKAFEEVGKKLTRTAGACGFRWNNTIRKKYVQAILQAKQLKQVKVNHPKKLSTQQLEDEFNINSIIRTLATLKATHEAKMVRIHELIELLKQVKSNSDQISAENNRLRQLIDGIPPMTDEEKQGAILNLFKEVNLLLKQEATLELKSENTG